MITVSALYRYPVKSCRGIAASELTLDERGPIDDRRWMVVDEAGVFMSQRERRRLALVDVQLTDEGIRLSAPGMEPLAVRVPVADDGLDFTATVWGDDARVRPAGRDADRWFSALLGVSARLVRQSDGAARVMRREYAGAIDEPRQVTLSDGAPLLLMGAASLDDLNARLESPVPMNRFRPNVVVHGAAPYAEDGWSRLAIGEVVFEVAKPCARCVITTVNQETAERGVEPLRTLARYRKVGSGVLFGQNIAHHAPGTVRVGDEVRVIA